MDTLSLRLFLRIAELGGLSAAARDLSLSPATASARLAKLEQELGSRLFNRTTRAVSLTTDGEAFLPYARESVDTLQMGVRAVRGEGNDAQGLLRVTMPGSFGRLHVVPHLAEFRRRYPGVTLDLRLSDEVLDVIEGAYDLVIRNAPLEESGLVARKLAPDKRLLVASPEYLETFGSPTSPNDLVNHRCVTLSGQRRFKFETGDLIDVESSVMVNDGEAMRDLIAHGAGIGICARWIASRHLSDGRLVEVLPDFPLVTESSLWALYPSNRIVAAKVRAMIDFLSERLKPAPWDA